MDDVTTDQIHTLRQKFQDKIKDESPDFCQCDIDRAKTDDIWIRRVLAENDQKMDQSCNMLYEICKWRKEFGTNDITDKSVPQHFLDKGVLFIRNKDIDGKHMLIFKPKYHVKGVEDLDKIKIFIVYFLERIDRVTKGDRITIMFDMDGAGLSNMDMDFVRYLITVLKTYYPHFINYLLIYEMNWILNAAWKIIKTWLPAKAVSRIKFVKKNNLKEFINEDNMLAEWGGKDNYTYSFEPEVRQKPEKKPVKKSRSRPAALESGGQVFQTMQSIPGAALTETLRRGAGDSPGGPQLVEVTRCVLMMKDDTEKISGQLQIRNASNDNHPMLYKVKTTAPYKFHATPSYGLLPGNSVSSISISVTSHRNIRSIPHERFQVQAIPAPQELLGQRGELSASELGGVWKKLAVNGVKIETHGAACALDASVTEEPVLPSGSKSVTMNEDEMRQGLRQIEKRIVDNVRADMLTKFQKTERLLYFVFALLILAVACNMWMMRSRACP